MRKSLKKVAILMVSAITLSLAVVGCGSSSTSSTQEATTETVTINASTATYDEMVSYLTSKGDIKSGTTAVDINTTKGYVTDNTGGQFPTAIVADKAYDYDGVWLFWWDGTNKTDNYETFESMKVNSGTIVISGGAAILSTEARNGSFAIAFSPDYANKDAVLADFEALESN